MANTGAGSGIEAVDALAHALTDLGFSISEPTGPGSNRGHDLTVAAPNGTRLMLEVKARSIVDPATALRVASGASPAGEPLTVVVADRISAAARRELNDRQMSWFDRRGHLRLVAPSVFLDTDVDATPTRSSSLKDGIRGRAGLAFAVATLLSPDDPPSIRGVAREAGLSAPSVSTAAASIRRAALVGTDGRPLLPDLFWATAEAWRPDFVPMGGDLLGALIGQADRLGVFGEADEPGWAATGAGAAAAWGAPVVVPSDSVPQFYVPDPATLARARRVLGEASSSPSCLLAVAPTPAASGTRRELTAGAPPELAHFFFTRPLFAALELANDPARGHEILEGWTPPNGARVW